MYFESKACCPCIIAVLIAIEFYHHFISQFIWSAIPEFFTSVEVGSTSSKNKNICSYDMSQKQEGTVIKFDKNHNLQSVLQLKQLGEGGWEGNSRERFVANRFWICQISKYRYSDMKKYSQPCLPYRNTDAKSPNIDTQTWRISKTCLSPHTPTPPLAQNLQI